MSRFDCLCGLLSRKKTYRFVLKRQKGRDSHQTNQIEILMMSFLNELTVRSAYPSNSEDKILAQKEIYFLWSDLQTDPFTSLTKYDWVFCQR